VQIVRNILLCVTKIFSFCCVVSFEEMYSSLASLRCDEFLVYETDSESDC